jgi:branched-chain amino acid transport system permease protein
MTNILQFFVSGLALGGQYALTTLGLVVVFGIMRLINFAYGELIMVAGYALWALTTAGVPWLLAALVGIVAATAAAVLMERVGFRPLREADATTLLITSFAISSFLQTAAQVYIWPRPVPVTMPPIFVQNFVIGGLRISQIKVITIVLTLVVLGSLTLLLKRTTLGLSLRAAAEDFTTTRLMGVNANRVVGAAFAIEGALAGIVLILWIGDSALVSPTIGLTPVLIAFMAGVVGGMRSLVGAVLGGFLVGFLFTALSAVLPVGMQQFRQGILFMLVVGILVFKPQGLIPGSYRREER